MNINSNELLLLKKVKFGEEATNKPADVTAPVTEPTETATPQAAMNALNFQGLNNVASAPQLATELKMMNEEEIPQQSEGESKEFVTPYKSNIAFQGKTSILKSAAFSALMALGMLGATASLTSCDKETITQTVTVDMDAIVSVISQLQALLQEMKEQQQITNNQLTQMNAFMQQLLQEVKNGNLNQEQFYQKMFEYMVENNTNQQIIIDQLIQNGQTQADANKLLKELIAQVEAGQISAEEAWNKIQNLLGDIKGLLGQVLTSLQKAEQDRAELISIAKDIKESSKVTNEQQKQMIAQNDSLIASNKLVISKLETISSQIEKANIDSNAGFDKVVNTLNMSKTELINVMIKLGYTQAQIEKMNAAEIIKAIKENTTATKNNTTRLEEINNEIKDGKIDAKAAADKIINLLEDINKNILNLTDSFNNFVKDYKNEKNEACKLLVQILKNGKVQTSILNQMNSKLDNMDSNISGIKASVDALLEIAQDDTKYNELMKTLKEIQANGSSNIDYQKLEEMFKALGINIADAINMSRSELVATIKDFEKTYVDTEQKQTEELQTIQAKIDDLQIFISNNNNKDLLDAINKLNQSVNNGSADVTNELKNIEAQLEKLQATVDAILKSIGSQASKVDVYFQKFDAKFGDILGKLGNIESQLNTIIANQKTAQVYLDNLLKEVQNLKEEIKKLQNQGGSGIDYDKLDQMWKEHDAANYEKYSKLIKELGIDPSKLDSIEDLLKSIDAKTSYIKQNNDILKQILDKLNNAPDYTAKLDKIIELLEKFKHNCNCGNNNEGILDELDKILG